MASTRTRWIAGLSLLAVTVSLIAWFLVDRSSKALLEGRIAGGEEDGRVTLNEANVRELEQRFERKGAETSVAAQPAPAHQVAPRPRPPVTTRAEPRLRGGAEKGARSARRPPAQPAAPSVSPEAANAAQPATAPASDASPGALATQAGARTQPDVREVVDNWIRALPWANIAFNAPNPMRFQRRVEIQLLLSSEESMDELIKRLGAPGSREAAEVKVSSRMKANLVGRGFDVVAIRPEEQAVGTSGTTEWRWEVTPTSDQPQGLLHLTLTALVAVDGSPVPIAVRTFDRWVAIEVTWTQRLSAFVGDYWQWLWAAVLVPLGAGIWRKIKAYRRLSSPSGRVPAASV